MTSNLIRGMGVIAAVLTLVIGGRLSAQPVLRTNLMLLEESGTLVSIRSRAQWQIRRAGILRAMQEVMGPFPGKEKRCPLEVRIEEETDCGDYVRRLITYSSEPGSRTPAYLLIPKSVLPQTKSPDEENEAGALQAYGVLCLHQTHSLGHKVVVGLGKSPNDEYGVELVKKGFVCIAPAYPLLAEYAPDVKGLGYQSGTMKAIWDNVRALDVLESLAYVHPGQFASIGHSLGGHNGIFTAAFEPRIKIVISSCGLDLFRDYMNGDIRGWTSLRYMPKLLDYEPENRPFDLAEVVAAIAPRFCFISAPVGDSNFRWQSVRDLTESAAPVFTLLHRKNSLQVTYPEAGHVFPREVREQAYELIQQVLVPEAKSQNSGP